MNRLWRRIEVRGDSMRPTLQPGDRLLVLRLPVRTGDLAAVRLPERVVVKRVAAVTPTTVDVRGDNAGHTTDYPAIPKADVLGRVVYRYAPADRAGRLK